jgi:hypothetical protein
VAAFLKKGSQEPDMRGFPAAFRSFKRDECSFFQAMTVITPD